MQIRDLMTTNVLTCVPEMTVADAARRMWKQDCGCLPVVDQDERIIGIVTDRDICIGLMSRDNRASEVAVGEVMSTDVTALDEEQSVGSALEAMRERKVRRIPLVNEQDEVTGILSLTDTIRASGTAGGVRVGEASLDAMRAICANDASSPRDDR